MRGTISNVPLTYWSKMHGHVLWQFLTILSIKMTNCCALRADFAKLHSIFNCFTLFSARFRRMLSFLHLIFTVIANWKFWASISSIYTINLRLHWDDYHHLIQPATHHNRNNPSELIIRCYTTHYHLCYPATSMPAQTHGQKIITISSN